MKKRILIVEDDDDIASIERDYLEVGGYEVKVEENGTAGLTEALTGEYDLILLDIMLPGMDGFQIVRKLRDKIDIPIMMVTARRSDIDKIRGLGFGADDYIEKPFSPGVLVARVKSQLAQYERLKGTGERRKKISIGGITLEPDTHRIFVRGMEKVLPNKEFHFWSSSWSMQMWYSAGSPCTPGSGAWILWEIRPLCRYISIVSGKRWRRIRLTRSIF